MTDNTINNDTLLKVRGEKSFEEKEDLKRYIKKLSSAILTVHSKHGVATLKVVGAPSMNNAIKASIIAIGEAGKKGINLIIIPSFDIANFDGNEKTAVVFKVEER